MRKLIFILFLLPTMLFGQAEGLTAGSWVNDYAGLLSEEEVNSLNQKISAFEKKTDIEIAVAIISTLDGQDIDSYKNELFHKWGVGKADRDNGLLLVIAPSEHKWGIELGYGLEPYMSDWESKDLAESYLVPAFKQEAYYDGLDQFLNATNNVLGGKSWEDRVAYAKKQQKEHDEAVANFWWGFLYVVLSIIGIVLLTYSFLKFKKKRDELELFKIKKKAAIDDYSQKVEMLNTILSSFGRPLVEKDQNWIKLLNGMQSEWDLKQHIIVANHSLEKYQTDIRNLKELRSAISEIKTSYSTMTRRESSIGLPVTPRYDASLEDMTTTDIRKNITKINMLVGKYNVISNQIDEFNDIKKQSPIPLTDAVRYSDKFKVSQNEKYQLDSNKVESNVKILEKAIEDFNSVELVFDNLENLKSKLRSIDSSKQSIYNHFNEVDRKNSDYRSIVSSLNSANSTLASHKYNLSKYLTDSDVSSSTKASISTFLLTMLAFKVGHDVYSSFNELGSLTSKVNALIRTAEDEVEEEERKRRKKREEEARKKREEEEEEARRRRRNSSSSSSSYGSSWSSSSSDSGSSFGGFGGGDSGGGGSSGSW